MFKNRINELAKESENDIRIIEVPFFYGGNRSEIIEKINAEPEIVERIHEILLSWKSESDVVWGN